VVATGCEAGEFQPGDRVVGECSIGCRTCRWCLKGCYHLCPDRAETGLVKQPGAFAEYIAFPKYFLHKCNELEHEQAALIEPTGVGVNTAKRSDVCPEDFVAVIASVLAPRARVAMTGLFAGAKCEVDFDPLVVTEVSILGCLGGPSLWPEAIALHGSGEVRTAEIITHRLPLADFARGIEIARHRTGGAIKVLLEP
jgi:L-iditol 2-dehydrogenase